MSGDQYAECAQAIGCIAITIHVSGGASTYAVVQKAHPTPILQIMGQGKTRMRALKDAAKKIGSYNDVVATLAARYPTLFKAPAKV